MEQTLGGRIKALRKGRTMTQDQLAELVGVSPQAVSKWENDISSPDISLLPRLAQVFGVTTDALLGVEPTAVAPAQDRFRVNVGQPEGDEPDEGRCGFTFQFDVGKKELPWFALAVLVFAVSLLLNRTLLSSFGEAGVWQLLWPSAMLALGLSGLWERLRLWAVGMTGFGIWCLLVNLNLLRRWDGLSWKLIVPALLVLWAVSMFADHFRRDRPSGHGSPEVCAAGQTGDGRLAYAKSFGSETVTVTEPVFRGGDVEVSGGNYILDLTACRTVEPGSRLNIHVSFGSVELLLPKNWKLQEHSVRSFSALSTHGSPSPDADQLLTVESSLSCSCLDIRW